MKYRITSSKFLTQWARFICCATGVLRQSRRINIKQINPGLLICIGVSKLCHHRLRWWLVTWVAPIYLVITTTHAGSLFCEQMSVNIIKMRRLSFKKMYLKIPSVKWQPVVTGLNVLANSTVHSEMHIPARSIILNLSVVLLGCSSVHLPCIYGTK